MVRGVVIVKRAVVVVGVQYVESKAVLNKLEDVENEAKTKKQKLVSVICSLKPENERTWGVELSLAVTIVVPLDRSSDFAINAEDGQIGLVVFQVEMSL